MNTEGGKSPAPASDERIINGVRYRSASEIAAMHGYVRDHVARLCRQGKVRGIRVSTTWYIDETSFLTYLRRYRMPSAANSDHTPSSENDLSPANSEQEKANARETLTHVITLVPPNALHHHVSRLQMRAARRALVTKLFSTATLALILTVGAFALATPNATRTASAQAEMAAAAADPGGFLAELGDGATSLSRSFATRVDAFIFGIALPGATLTYRAPAGVGGNTIKTSAPTARVATAASTTTTTAPLPSLRTIVEQPIIQRIVEQLPTPAPAQLASAHFVTQDQLNTGLSQLSNSLRELVFQNIRSPNSLPASGGFTNSIALTQRVDQLSGTTIANPTITGGSISGVTLSASDLSGVVAIAKGGTGTTTAPVYGQLLVGNAAGGYSLLATSSLGIVGGGGSGTPGGSDTQIQFNNNGAFGGDASFTFSTSTKQLGATGAVFTNATTTNATSTNFFAQNASTTNATSTSLFSVLGNFTTGIIDTLSATVATITSLTATNLVAINATTTNATTTNLAFTNATGTNATSTNLFATTASSTNLFSQTASLGTLTLVNALTVADGGTGSTTLSGILKGNGTGVLKTAVGGTDYEFPLTFSTGLNRSGNTITNTGVLSLGSGYATSTGTSIAFSTTTQSFNGLTIAQNITASAGALTLAPNISGTLNNSGLTNSSLTVSAGSGLSGGGSVSLGGSTSLSLNLGNANAWTALQQIANASSTLTTLGTTWFNGNTSALLSTDASGKLQNTTVSYPLQFSGATLSTAFGTTTSNTFAGTQTFTNAPIFSALAGLIGVGGGQSYSVSTSTLNIGGNAQTATALQTARTINGVSFDGSTNITITAASSTLLANSNTFSGNNTFNALQQFSNASSSLLSVFNKAYFGGTATSTFDNAGNLSLVSNGLTVGTNQLLVSGGNVGIGTTSPTTMLSLANSVTPAINLDFTTTNSNGALTFSQGSVNGASIRLEGSTVAQLERQSALEIASAGPINFRNTTGTEFGRFNASGMFGVGTTTPWGQIAISTPAQQSGTIPLFNIASTTNASLFAVLGNGNVGIGTTSPGTTLDVKGSTITRGFQFFTDVSAATTSAMTMFGYSSGGLSYLDFGKSNSNGANGFTWGTGIDAFRIYENGQIYAAGKLGIGTGSPLSTLDVNGGVAVGSFAGSTAAPSNGLIVSGGVALGDTSPGGFELQVKGSANLQASSGVSSNLSLSDSNNLPLYLIRTSPDSNSGNFEILQLSTTTGAEINRTSYSRSTSNWSFPASVCATNLSCSSDQRLKQNIAPIAYGLSDVMKLQPVSYEYNDTAVNGGFAQSTTTPQIGFIAQQVQAVIPEAVFQNQGADKYLGVNYALLTSVLTKSIQDIANITSMFQQNLIAWLGNASNGIGDLYASAIHAHQVTADQLCAGSVCVNQQQLAALLAAQGASGTNTQSTPQQSPAASSSPLAASNTPPTIVINGENPAHVNVGDTYADLGATIKGPQADLNLGIKTFLNGTLTSNIVIDTSAVATNTIDYVVSDQSALTSTSTRTVIVEFPSIVPTHDAATSTAPAPTITPATFAPPPASSTVAASSTDGSSTPTVSDAPSSVPTDSPSATAQALAVQ